MYFRMNIHLSAKKEKKKGTLVRGLKNFKLWGIKNQNEVNLIIYASNMTLELKLNNKFVWPI